MNKENPVDDGRVVRRTLPTASFSLTVPLVLWIEEESKRRGIQKSQLVREILEACRAENQVAA